jgi:hypothetical protein
MWTRKSDVEIQKILARREANKKNLLRPFVAASAITLVVMVLYVLGFRGRAQSFIIEQPTALDWRVPAAGLFVFALCFPIAVYRQRRNGQLLGRSDEMLRCVNCTELNYASPSKICPACGGQQEPSLFFVWVDDNNSDTS